VNRPFPLFALASIRNDKSASSVHEAPGPPALPKTSLMPTTPACQLFERGPQCHTVFGQGVHGAQHTLAVHSRSTMPSRSSFAELRCEHFLRDLRNTPLQLTVAYPAGLELRRISGFHFPPITSIAVVTAHSLRSMYTTYRVRGCGGIRTKKCVIDTGCRPEETWRT